MTEREELWLEGGGVCFAYTDDYVDSLRARVVELEQSLSRIVSYYDLAKTGSSFPAMTVQAMAEHENTMFGEARKVLKNGR